MQTPINMLLIAYYNVFAQQPLADVPCSRALPKGFAVLEDEYSSIFSVHIHAIDALRTAESLESDYVRVVPIYSAETFDHLTRLLLLRETAGVQVNV
jgi:hypothetical protein